MFKMTAMPVGTTKCVQLCTLSLHSWDAVTSKTVQPRLTRSQSLGAFPAIDLRSPVQAPSSISQIVGSYFQTNEAFASKLLHKIPAEHLVSVDAALCNFGGKIKVSEDPRIVGALDKLRLKLVGIVGLVLPELRKEALPARVKARLIDANVVDFFVKAVSKICYETIFQDFDRLIEEYNQHVLNIKRHLFASEEGQAIGWKQRNPFLFVWCRILIEETGHPALELLKASPDQVLENQHVTDKRMRAEDLRRISYDIFSKFVLPLTCADDIADILQDKELLLFFTNAFISDSYSGFKQISADAKVKMMVPKSKYEAYRPFFKFYIQTFQSAMRELETLVGESRMNTAWTDISMSWQMVMACLQQSIDINQDLTSTRHVLTPMDVKADELMLAQNMLMSFFKQLEKQIIAAYCIQDPVADNSGRDIVFKKAEILGHAANHWATLSREIEEGDYSNTLLILLDNQISGALLVEDRLFHKYCRAHARELGVLPSEIVSFRGLLSYLKKLDRSIVAQSSKVLEQIGYSEDGFLACSSSKVLCKFVESECDKAQTLATDASREAAVPALNAELSRLAQEKQDLSQFVLNLAKKLRIFESYGERMDSIFDQMDEEAAADTAFSSYISGVENLVALYLACKREI